MQSPTSVVKAKAFLSIWLIALAIFTVTFTVFAHPTASLPTAAPKPKLPLTSPCASGEALPEWVVCVYGTVFETTGTDANTPLNGAAVALSLNGRTVTGTTYVHPGQITPTYSIDISSLEPKFLQPVSLTAVYGSQSANYQVILNPDFNTLSQRFDVPLSLNRGLLWGYVTDYISGTAVAGATISATYGHNTVFVTTQQRPYDPLPYYRFTTADLNALGVTTGQLLTLTASYNGDHDRITVVRPAGTRQFNFSTSWYCDDFEALPREGGLGGLPREGGLGGLPREGGLGGLPREGGLGGLPNVACLWGYVTVDRQASAGVAVNLTISDTVYAGTTRLFSGETTPRYGIAVPADVLTDGQTIAATAVYSGATATVNVPAMLNAGYSQQINLQISGLNALGDFVNANTVDDVLFRDDRLWWMSRGGGVIVYNPVISGFVQLTTLDGFPSNEMRTIADSGDGNLWLGSDAGLTRYNPTTNLQQSWGEADDLLGIPLDIAITAEGVLYIATTKGYSTFDPATGAITNQTTATTGLSANPLTVAYDAANNDIWFGTVNQGADQLDLDTSLWSNFTTPDLTSSTVNDIAIHASGEIWFATENGVTRMIPGTPPSWQQFTAPAALPSNTVRDIDATAASIWIATDAGAAQYAFTPKIWTIYNLLDGLASEDLMAVDAVSDSSVWFGSNGAGLITFDGVTWGQVNLSDSLINNNVQAIDQNDTDGTLWFGTAAGISHYRPNLLPRWENFGTFAGLNGNDVQALIVAPDETVWVGTDGWGAAYYAAGVWTAVTTVDGLSNNDVQAIAVDNNNVAWLGTAAGLTRYEIGQPTEVFTTGNSSLLSDDIRAVAASNTGYIWLGTYGGGVTRYDPNLNAWQTFTTADGLLSDFVQALAVDNQYLWVGTILGVNRYDLVNDSWTSFTTADGLSDNNILAIELANNGVVWFGSSSQATRYTPGGHPTWELFTNTTGSPFVQAIAALSDSDTVWFGSGSGAFELFAPSQQADIAVSITSNSVALPSAIVSYTITLVNQGLLDATDTVVALALPSQLTYQTAELTPASLTPLFWLVDVPVGPPVTFVVTAELAANIAAGTSLTSTVDLFVTVPEPFKGNNSAANLLLSRDPDRADLRVSLYGPPVLPPGADVVYIVQLDNNGGLAAANSQLVLDLPAQLTFQSATIPPSNPSTLTWNLGVLGIRDVRPPLEITVRVASGAAADVRLPVSATASTSTAESNTLNNTAAISVATTLDNAHTLILVAPERLTARYGASTIMDDLYRLALHPQVQGVVVDVLADTAVRSAFTTWDTDPINIHKANAVAGAIKALIDQYTIAYPELQYLVFVGGDETLPFYRVLDQSDAEWQENRYASFLPEGTVRAAMAQNYFLTDDFYADRTPTAVRSAFWRDAHPLYLPDFASGRLVETPAEIRATIDAFLDNDGLLDPSNPLIGSTIGDSFRPGLTADWDDYVCNSLTTAGLAPLCRQTNSQLRTELLDPATHYGSIWSSQHSNHFTLGRADSVDVRDFTLGYSGTLLVTIGCHAGLNVPQPAAPGTHIDYDLMQAFAGQGGTAIASTAYGYASDLGRSYSELLASDLTDSLLDGSAASLGEALVQAKQRYFARLDSGSAATGGIDYVDEKVLLPLTLYGLPMVQFGPTTPLPTLENMSANMFTMPQQGQSLTVVTKKLSNLTFNQHVTAVGRYYDYQGQIIERATLPVQPAHQIDVPYALNNGQTVRGVLLRAASYTAVANFEPLLTQIWAISEDQTIENTEGTKNLVAQSAPSLFLLSAPEAFDRPLPYGLSIFRGVNAQDASLNLTLGAFNNATAREYLYNGLTLELLYGDSQLDHDSPPQIGTSLSYKRGKRVYFYVQAADDIQVVQVVGVCDDGAGHWQSVELELTQGVWSGSCATAVRSYVQVVDTAGQVTSAPWQAPSANQLRPFVGNLPLIRR